jgi:hypothetical protein
MQSESWKSKTYKPSIMKIETYRDIKLDKSKSFIMASKSNLKVRTSFYNYPTKPARSKPIPSFHPMN